MVTYYIPHGRPTKEKKRLHGFMERHKKKGVVSLKKLGKYARKKGLKSEYKYGIKTASSGYGPKSKMHIYNIKSKRGKKIGQMGVKHKKSPRVVWWVID